jgi:hypothetical protein
MNSEKYIGLDVHQATISSAVLDSKGKLVMESILETQAAGLRGTLIFLDIPLNRSGVCTSLRRPFAPRKGLF